MKHIDRLFRFYPYAAIFSVAVSFCLSVFVVEHGTLAALFYTFFNSVALGTTLAFGFIEIKRSVDARRHEKIRGLMPRSIQELGSDQYKGTRMMGVSLINGDMRTIELPIDYRPTDDGGKLLLEAASPELFELLDMDELEITSEELDE